MDLCVLFSMIDQGTKGKINIMPKVGGKHFSYSKAGQKAAKSYAKATGKAVTKRKAKPKRKSK